MFFHNIYAKIFNSQERNKPKEPPKVPKVAPFFLPTIPGLQPQFAPIGEDEDLNEVSVIFN